MGWRRRLARDRIVIDTAGKPMAACVADLIANLQPPKRAEN